jgi:hypothetical protein
MPDEDIQVVDTTSSDDEQDIEIELDDSEDIEAPQEKTYSEQQFKQVLARAKKAEAEAKALKPRTVEAPKTETSPSSPSDVAEVVLKAQGMEPELLKELKAISQLRKVDLIDAQNDPLFKAVKENFEKEKKEKAASLGASRGSGQAKEKVTTRKPDLSREEHMELAKKLMK